jgi:hypothetical protein
MFMITETFFFFVSSADQESQALSLPGPGLGRWFSADSGTGEKKKKFSL